MTTDIIEGEVREIVPVQQAVSLWHTDEPAEVVEKATKTAKALADVIRSQRLAVNIQGKEYVTAEGYTLLGSMLGVFPVTLWTRELPDGKGWEARVEARRGDQTIGAAEAMCTRDERRWGDADEYAVRSMAQTRATAKALRMPLGFVMKLAGYAPTPLEEMDGVKDQAQSRERWGDAQPADTVRAPRCKSHDVPMKFFKAGKAGEKSKSPGQPYDAFWKCFIKDCKVSVTDALWRDQLTQMATPADEKVDYGDLPQE